VSGQLEPSAEAWRSAGIAARVGFIVLLTACGPAPGAEDGRVATSSDGMVVSSSAAAARVGAEILAVGGNAVDAAVATAFALAVAEPTQSGLGGRTQTLVWRPPSRGTAPGAGGSPFGVDATTVVPAGHDPDARPEVDDGYPVIATPGTVAGLAHLLDEAGSMSWADVIEPAVGIAESGFALSEGEAERLNRISDRLRRSEGARDTFLRPDGSEWSPGDRLVQPDLARVLRTLGEEGPGVFYEGWIAEKMVADLAENGASVAALDLATYQAEESIVARGRFGELELVGTYLPASGATTIEALQIIERLDLPDLDPEVARVALGEALLAAFQDREIARRDARPAAEDAAWITSPELADRRAEEIRGRLADGITKGPSETSDSRESAHTSHISVMDADGMAVAMTQSLGPTGGSRVATPGLGFLYAATLGYLDREEPGDRPWSSQSPLVVLRDGRPVLVMGGAGGRRIISALVQTLVRLELEGVALTEAMEMARFHPTGRWHFEQLDSLREPVGAELARFRGNRVLVRPFDDYFGRLNVISIDPRSGVMTGVADPRWPWGAAAGVEAGPGGSLSPTGGGEPVASRGREPPGVDRLPRRDYSAGSVVATVGSRGAHRAPEPAGVASGAPTGPGSPRQTTRSEWIRMQRMGGR